MQSWIDIGYNKNMRFRRRRNIFFDPKIKIFKPKGVRLRDIDRVFLRMDEVEALRLRDVEDIAQIKAAKKMGVSQPTFFRILKSARRKISDAVVNGKAIEIGEGE